MGTRCLVNLIALTLGL